MNLIIIIYLMMKIKKKFFKFIKELIEQKMLIETIYNDMITYLLNKNYI